MFVESTILVDVLLRLVGLRIPALPIHDAILVPRSACEPAKRVMLEAFEEHVGVPGRVDVSQPLGRALAA